MSCRKTGFYSRLHREDYTTPPTQEMTVGAPLGEAVIQPPMPLGWVICYSTSWLWWFLALNLTTIQLGPNFHFKNYSLNVLPVGPVPTLITKSCCYINHSPPCSIFCPFLLSAMTLLVEVFWLLFLIASHEKSLILQVKQQSGGTLEGKE